MQVDSDKEAHVEQCWFCKERVADAASAAIVEMHLGGFIGKSQDYQVKDTNSLFVPRCERCKLVHDRVEGYVAKGGILGLLIGIVAAFITIYEIGIDSINNYWKALLIEIALFIMVGGIAAWIFSRVLIPKGIMDQRIREHYPDVQRKIREGWKIGPKPPGL